MKTKAVVIRMGEDLFDIRAIALFDSVFFAQSFVERHPDVVNSEWGDWEWRSECTDADGFRTGESYSYSCNGPGESIFLIDVVEYEDD